MSRVPQPLFELGTRHRMWIMTTNMTAIRNVGTVLITGNNSCRYGLAFCNCLRGLCIRLCASWAINLVRDVGGRVQCLFLRQKLGTFKLEQLLHTVTPPQPANYRLCVPQNSNRLDFLLWQVYFWISYFGKCIFNTRLNSDVLRKDILAGMFILSGFYGYITCVTSEINACRADPGGLEV